MAGFRTLDDIGDVQGKRVLVRVDLNVPMADGKVSDLTRIERVAPTILELADKGAKVILMAHFGRPKDGRILRSRWSRLRARRAKSSGVRSASCRTALARRRKARCSRSIRATSCCWRTPGSTRARKRTIPTLPSSSPPMAKSSSTTPSPPPTARMPRPKAWRTVPAYAGRTMQAELEALEAGLGNPKRPVVAIVGGAKVSTKIDLLMNLVKRVDALVIGGGMANTFLAARGTNVGKSLCEHDLADTAKQIMIEAASAICAIVLPSDGVVAKEFKAGAKSEVVDIENVPADSMILDVGPKTVEAIHAWIDRAETLVWNGRLVRSKSIRPRARGHSAGHRGPQGTYAPWARRGVRGHGGQLPGRVRTRQRAQREDRKLARGRQR